MRILKIVSFNLLFLCALLLACEAALAFLHPVRYCRAYPGEAAQRLKQAELQYWVTVDKDLGWVLAPHHGPPNLKTPELKPNAQGFRDPRDFAPPLADTPLRAVVLGDSFIAGYGVRHENTVPALLEKELGGKYEVYNLGIPGWGVDQMYLGFLKYAPVLKPRMAVLVFIEDDIIRTGEAFSHSPPLPKPAFMVRGGTLVRDTRKGPGRVERVFQRSYLLNIPYRLVSRFWLTRQVGDAVFRELARSAREQGCELTLVKFPERESEFTAAGLMTRELVFSFKGMCAKNGIRFFDMQEQFSRLTKEQRRAMYLADGHPSAQGQEFLAQFIRDHVFRE